MAWVERNGRSAVSFKTSSSTPKGLSAHRGFLLPSPGAVSFKNTVVCLFVCFHLFGILIKHWISKWQIWKDTQKWASANPPLG